MQNTNVTDINQLNTQKNYNGKIFLKKESTLKKENKNTVSVDYGNRLLVAEYSSVM